MFVTLDSAVLCLVLYLRCVHFERIHHYFILYIIFVSWQVLYPIGYFNLVWINRMQINEYEYYKILEAGSQTFLTLLSCFHRKSKTCGRPHYTVQAINSWLSATELGFNPRTMADKVAHRQVFSLNISVFSYQLLIHAPSSFII
jgi:hypothetical protein